MSVILVTLTLRLPGLLLAFLEEIAYLIPEHDPHNIEWTEPGKPAKLGPALQMMYMFVMIPDLLT